ncbi:polyprenyl synthetase family protein [Bradyrhizobium lablabi]|uniref:polyprenyl synthetase family protein n=1 Tax=Bradyrhizobium lablabi TaxID=722472 RepID=UPI001BAA6119|nr:polyprenyl synthetase family protein [Bradyrhizobium lablabi]MBR0696735.1 polyprenyl synthetase family protein [Bradyrhizobium lablabi]
MSPEGGWIENAEVYEALERLGPVLMDMVSSDHPSLAERAAYLASLGGKRIRPAMLFVAHGSGCTRIEVVRAAASVELIHLASLYHDDIMDRGLLRRGFASANAKWGNATAMLTGTFLFLRAQALTEALGPRARKLAATSAAELCLGQLRESENAYNTELPAEDHLEVIALKTGSLFRLALQLGALLGGVGRAETEALTRYARHLGLAFQLSDDLLDIEGDAATTGKETLADIRAGVYSLPWLLLIRSGKESSEIVKRIFARNRLSDGDVREALTLLLCSDAIPRARDILAAQIRQGIDALHFLSDRSAANSLANLATSMAGRTR